MFLVGLGEEVITRSIVGCDGHILNMFVFVRLDFVQAFSVLGDTQSIFLCLFCSLMATLGSAVTTSCLPMEL